MTIFRYIIIFLLTLDILTSCNHCDESIKTWKNDAVIDIIGLKNVTKEISEQDSVFNAIKFDNESLYLDNRVLEEMSQENKKVIPRLREWFQKTAKKTGSRSSISYKNGSITASFKTCIYKSISYEGCLYYSKSGIRPSFTENWKPQVELLDSLDLGDNWYYILTRCDGCIN